MFNKLAFLIGTTVLVSACAQTPDAKSRYGSAPEVVCCTPTPPPPPCGVYVPCQPPVILQAGPPVVEYVEKIEYKAAPLPEPPVYVEPEPAPPVYVEPEPAPPVIYVEPEPPVYEPPQSWPEPAEEPPIWLPRK